MDDETVFKILCGALAGVGLMLGWAMATYLSPMVFAAWIVITIASTWGFMTRTDDLGAIVIALIVLVALDLPLSIMYAITLLHSA